MNNPVLGRLQMGTAMMGFNPPALSLDIMICMAFVDFCTALQQLGVRLSKAVALSSLHAYFKMNMISRGGGGGIPLEGALNYS